MIYFKSCERCIGDRTLERDMYGWYIICLNCGHVSYPEVSTKQNARLETVERLRGSGEDSTRFAAEVKGSQQDVLYAGGSQKPYRNAK